MLMLAREMNAHKHFGNGVIRWVPYEEIAPVLKKAVVVAEDRFFFKHSGIDFGAVKAAYGRNKNAGKVIYGGSTITQQTARNLFLWEGRSWIRKSLEAYFSFLIEFFWNKRRILEVYLNVIEYGDHLYGIEAAADKYFGVPASGLTLEQACLIAVCLPNPYLYSPLSPSEFIQEKSRHLRLRLEYDETLTKFL